MIVREFKSHLRSLLTQLESVDDNLPVQSETGDDMFQLIINVCNKAGGDVTHPLIEDKVAQFVDVALR